MCSSDLKDKWTVVDSQVYWEPKRDGSNITLLLHDGEILIYTRNQLANPDIQIEVKRLYKPFKEGINKLLTINPQYNIYCELLRKGKSPARFEVNEEASLIAFDIFDTIKEQYIKPEAKYNIFRCYGIPYLEYVYISKSESIGEFEKLIDKMIDKAKDQGGPEGYVAKWWQDCDTYMVKVKVEHKYNKPQAKKKET